MSAYLDPSIAEPDMQIIQGLIHFSSVLFRTDQLAYDPAVTDQFHRAPKITHSL